MSKLINITELANLLNLHDIKKGKPLTITDPKMTRFTVTMDDALEFILNASDTGKGSEIFIPKLKSYEMPILIEALSELCGKTEQEKAPPNS